VIDVIVSGVSIAVLIGVIYWAQRTFVSEKTCKARQDCLEGSINGLKELMLEKFKHVEELIEKLIR